MKHATTKNVQHDWYVYMLSCADGTLYTGSTNDLARRLKEHNTSPQGAKYTRARRPVKLVYSAIAASRSEAAKEEARIKNLSRSGKLVLVKEDAGRCM